MTKREKKYFIRQYIIAKNLADWFEHRKKRDNLEEDQIEYVQKRYDSLDREAMTLAGIAMDLKFWDDMWNAYWEQRIERTY